MARWNPNSPAIIGIEWLPTRSNEFVADSIAKSVVETLNQTAVQNIGAIRVYIPSSSTPTHSGIVVEVFDNDNGSITLPILHSIFRPNQDVAGVGAVGPGWRDQAGGIVNIFNSINDSPPDLATFIQAQCTINGGVMGWLSNTYQGRFNIGVGNLVGQRILSVDMLIIGSKFASAAVDLLFEMRPGGGVWSEFKRMANAPDWRTRVAQSLIHPVTFRPWLITEAEDFDVASEFTLRGFAHTPGSFIGVAEVEMHVNHVPETRLALGGREATASTGWLEVSNIVRPDGGVWAKDGAGEHLYITRRIQAPENASDPATLVGSRSFSVRTIGGSDPLEGQGFQVDTEPSFGTIIGMDDPDNTLYPLIQRTTAPADSVDSQPYVNLEGAHVYVDGVGFVSYARQEYSGASTATYGLCRCLVRRTGTPQVLIAGVFDVGTGLPVSGAAFLQSSYDSIIHPQVPIFDDLPEIENGWRLAEMPFLEFPGPVIGGVDLIAGNQYYVEFNEFTFGFGNGPDSYWEIAYLDTLGQGNIANFGDTTDAAYIDGGARDVDLDLIAQLAIVPDAPTNPAVTLSQQPLDGECETCTVEFIEYGAIVWDATTLAAAFGYYEIQRSDDAMVSWQTIALIEDESVVAFPDYGGRRATESCYRIRVVTSIGIPSLWTDPFCVTYSANNCEFIFVSNDDPSLNVAYEPSPERTYEFIDAEETVIQAIYGRDYQLAFQPTEQRGARFRLQLRVSLINTVGRGGIAQFDAIRAMATADIPEVTVLDMYGNRFYAHLDAPTGTHREPFASYVAEVLVTETSGVPTPVVVP